MKMNKIIDVRGMIVGVAALIMAITFGCAPIEVLAQSNEPVCICQEKCRQDSQNTDCEVCMYDSSCCQGEEPENAVGEETADSESYGPLTPDGNMNLVDDYGTTEAGGKQFITVTTKSGNYFYLIIDRDDKGAETVHFLNLVDEADLLALMEEDEAKSYLEAQEKTLEEKQPEVNESEETVEMPIQGDGTAENDKKGNSYMGIMVVILLGTAGGIGAYLYLKTQKRAKRTVEPDPDPDDVDAEDEDYLKDLGIDEDPILDFSDEEADLLAGMGDSNQDETEE